MRAAIRSHVFSVCVADRSLTSTGSPPRRRSRAWNDWPVMISLSLVEAHDGISQRHHVCSRCHRLFPAAASDVNLDRVHVIRSETAGQEILERATPKG